MPNYKYHCTSCEHIFTEFQTMTADPLIKCPECGKESLKRLIGSGTGLIFKGSGFYTTDYKKSAAPPPAAAPAPACSKEKPDSPACKSCAASSKKD